jgi:hypothetical protein
MFMTLLTAINILSYVALNIYLTFYKSHHVYHQNVIQTHNFLTALYLTSSELDIHG